VTSIIKQALDAGTAVPDWIAFLDAFFKAVVAYAAAGQPFLFVENAATPEILPSARQGRTSVHRP
jgi:hypothetical protein